MLKEKSFLSISDILTYITAICIILDIGCVYTHLGDRLHLWAVARYLPAILLIFRILLLRIVDLKRIKIACICVLLIYMYLVFYMLVSSSRISITLLDIILLCVIMAYFILVELKGKPNLLIAVRNLLFLLAFFSVFMWLFCCILKIIPPTSEITVYWGGEQQVKSFLMLHFERESAYLFGRTIVSNRSIFTERAFAAFAFFIGWIYELFCERKQSKIRLIVFLVALISTFSITALISIIITSILFFSINNKRSVKIFKWSVMPIVLLVGVLGIRYFLVVKFSRGISATSRLSDLENGINAWISKPLYGYGYTNSEMINTLFHTGFSNSISMILTRGGIWLAILYIIYG